MIIISGIGKEGWGHGVVHIILIVIYDEWMRYIYHPRCCASARLLLQVFLTDGNIASAGKLLSSAQRHDDDAHSSSCAEKPIIAMMMRGRLHLW